MTSTSARPVTAPARESRTLRLVMCRPEHFEVTYAINPWMDPSVLVDTARALQQWDALKATYEAHGHHVDVMHDTPGLPDLVYTANAGIVRGDKVMISRFAHPQRRAESPISQEWFREAGFGEVVMASETNEGEGDFLLVGDEYLAGTGFRSTPAAHREVAEFFGVPVTTLHLVDPRFYHLDTALSVLDEHTIAYYPAAFDEASQRVLAERFPDALLASEADAAAFGLNSVCDGRRVYLPAAAPDLPYALRERGYEPVGIELDELLRGGGSVKCCTLLVNS